MDTTKLFEPLPKGPISEIIVQRITDALIDGNLRPGDKIPTEQEFSENLGVGRNAVREAIKVLTAFGVLEVRRSEGTFVVEEYHQNLIDPLLYSLPLTEKSMDDILEFKVSIHYSLFLLAVTRATDEELAQLRRYCDVFYEASKHDQVDVKELFATSEQYNLYMGEISHNPLLVKVNKIALQMAKYARIKTFEVTIQQQQPAFWAEAYYQDLEVLESRDVSAVSTLMANRLKTWQSLL